MLRSTRVVGTAYKAAIKALEKAASKAEKAAVAGRKSGKMSEEQINQLTDHAHTLKLQAEGLKNPVAKPKPAQTEAPTQNTLLSSGILKNTKEGVSGAFIKGATSVGTIVTAFMMQDYVTRTGDIKKDNHKQDELQMAKLNTILSDIDTAIADYERHKSKADAADAAAAVAAAAATDAAAAAVAVAKAAKAEEYRKKWHEDMAGIRKLTPKAGAILTELQKEIDHIEAGEPLEAMLCGIERAAYLKSTLDAQKARYTAMVALADECVRNNDVFFTEELAKSTDRETLKLLRIVIADRENLRKVKERKEEQRQIAKLECLRKASEPYGVFHSLFASRGAKDGVVKAKQDYAALIEQLKKREGSSMMLQEAVALHEGYLMSSVRIRNIEEGGPSYNYGPAATEDALSSPYGSFFHVTRSSAAVAAKSYQAAYRPMAHETNAEKDRRESFESYTAFSAL